MKIIIAELSTAKWTVGWHCFTDGTKQRHLQLALTQYIRYWRRVINFWNIRINIHWNMGRPKIEHFRGKPRMMMLSMKRKQNIQITLKKFLWQGVGDHFHRGNTWRQQLPWCEQFRFIILLLIQTHIVRETSTIEPTYIVRKTSTIEI